MATSNQQNTLHGSCACGRNRYTIDIPSEQTALAELQYDNSNASRHHAANPLMLWLRVPLTWYTSATFAQFPDEHHASILRTFTSPFAIEPRMRRQFCGYCGTQLTAWHERTADDAEHISLTVGSLLDEDQALLGQLGYLPGADSSDEETDHRAANASRQSSRVLIRNEPLTRGAPWFEELVEHTKLGRYRQRRGGHQSRDGGVRIEWEVVEWTEGDDVEQEGSATPTKRKIGDLDAGDDIEMRSA